jgi:carboxymethylenebutenolidase
LAPGLKVAVLGLYGGKDQGIPLESIEQMRAALGPDSKSKIIVYPDAPHGFNADYRESYVEADAKEAWSEMLAFFQANGVY